MRELYHFEAETVSGSGGDSPESKKIPITVIKEGIGGLGKVLTSIDWSNAKEAFIPKPNWNSSIGYWHGGF
ncbi:hypothetical protein DTF36_17635 [Salmonella enterica subsp. enterica]|nr:hypothetical protein [Salmonella enterica subsp. enterica]MKP46095.1 hypothetical protein [Salmonella enterica subsp. enterica]